MQGGHFVNSRTVAFASHECLLCLTESLTEARKAFETNLQLMEPGVLDTAASRFRGQDEVLRLFGITRAGLLAMTLSVSALWGCIAVEKVTLRRAANDSRACLEELQHLREQTSPASEPVPHFRTQPPSAS